MDWSEASFLTGTVQCCESVNDHNRCHHTSVSRSPCPEVWMGVVSYLEALGVIEPGMGKLIRRVPRRACGLVTVLWASNGPRLPDRHIVWFFGAWCWSAYPRCSLPPLTLAVCLSPRTALAWMAYMVIILCARLPLILCPIRPKNSANLKRCILLFCDIYCIKTQQQVWR